MKKILILAYDFPPYISVGGLRPYSWYKYLTEFGVYPIVITRQWSNNEDNHVAYIKPSESKHVIVEESGIGTLIKTPYIPNFPNRLKTKYGDTKYKFLRKIFTAYYEIAQFLFLTGPKSQLYFAAKEYLKTNLVDFIIASGDPFVLFYYASKLSKIYNVPWIADYRDPWSQDISIQKRFVYKFLSRLIEKKVVKNSSYIITVSDFVKSHISKLFKNKEYFILPNGYDPEVIERISTVEQQHDALNIAFVGTIYNWHPIKSFLSVFSEFISKNKNVKVKLNLYGINISYELNNMISMFFSNITNHINIISRCPNEQLVAELARNNVLLLFNSYSYMGTKIYDYIGVKRKILFCYSDDKDALALKKKYFNIDESKSARQNLQEALLGETKSGIIVRDAVHLSEILGELYREFEEHGLIACESINTQQLSRKIQVQKLAEIILKRTE